MRSKLTVPVLLAMAVFACDNGPVGTTSDTATSLSVTSGEPTSPTTVGSPVVTGGASGAPPTTGDDSGESGGTLGDEVPESTAGILFEPTTVILPTLGAPETGIGLVGAATAPDVIGGGPSDVGADTVEEIAELSIADIEFFWSNHWESEYPTVFYESPAGSNLYDSAASELPATTCTESSTDPTDWANNAFYCYGDRTISVDIRYALSELSSSGDFAVVGTYAHEWGHHLQNLLLGQMGAADHPTFSIEAELQADCFAGIYTRGAGSSGSFPVSAEDLSEAANSFYLSGTDAEYGWFEPVFHGTRQQRYDAFLHGYNQGEARACDSYATYMRSQVYGTGPYSVGYLEGASVSALSGGGFEIRGEGYGDTVLQGNSYDLETTLTEDTVDDAFLDVLRSWAPSESESDGIALVPLTDLEDFSTSTQSWGIPGITWGFAYSQELASGPVHGYVIVNINWNGRSLVLDVFRAGPAPSSDDGWQPIVDNSVRALRSFQSS